MALQRIRKDHRILDVGCGTGTDALLMARWGYRRIHAIDPDPKAIATARGRATRTGLAGRVKFYHLAAEDLSTRFPPRSFDIVLHTLVANNLTRNTGKHFGSVAEVMRPDGLLILQERVTRSLESERPGAVPALPSLRKHFRLTKGISTHLPEVRASPSAPGYARVVIWLGLPRTVTTNDTRPRDPRQSPAMKN